MDYFEGFKLRMGGRLTRKQRASSFWMSVGNIPLSTIGSHLEYAFYSLPLRIVKLQYVYDLIKG